jgi:hypothetical protein
MGDCKKRAWNLNRLKRVSGEKRKRSVNRKEHQGENPLGKVKEF